MKTANVLLIEDSQADIELVKEALEEARVPHVLHVAMDLEEARSYLKRIPADAPCPDVMLMDINLPQGNGFELLQSFKEKAEWQGIPVIVVSSSDAQRDRDQAARLGAAQYFRKPMDLNEFMKLGPIVVKWLERKAQETTPD